MTPPTGSSAGRVAAWAFLIGNGISLLGNTFALVAIPWFVIETTDSAARTGLAGMMGALPALLAGLIGGTLVDRYGGRLMSIVSDVVSGVAVLLIPLLYQTVGLNFATLLALVLLGAMLDVPGLTARRTMLPDLAAAAGWRDERMNASFENSQSAAFIVGPLLAGVLIGPLGAVNLLWFTGFSFFASVIAIAIFAPAHTVAADHQEGSMVSATLAGIRYVARDPFLLTLALSLSMLNFLITPFWSVVMLIDVRHAFNDASKLGLLIALFGIGNLAGGALYGAIGHRYQHVRRAIYLGGVASFPAYIWLVVANPGYPALVVGAMIMGFMTGPINPLMVTVRMERIPRELRGRVFASFTGLTGTAIPLGMLFAGWVMGASEVRQGLIAIAAIATVMVVALALVPVLREMNHAPSGQIRAKVSKSMQPTSE